MLKVERQNYIIDMLRKHKTVRITELTSHFDVSDETIRRDFVELEKAGLLKIVRGGAMYNSPTASEPQYDMRMGKYLQEKDAICRRAAELVEDGDAIAIQGSTTTFFLGKYLADKKNLSVITNMVDVAIEIKKEPSNLVILTGGVLWAEQMKTMGELAENDFSNFQVDKAFVSVTGLSPEAGLTEYKEMESRLTKSVMSSAYKTILLNDSSKFDTLGFRKICKVKNVNTIITDWNAEPRDIGVYKDMDIDVIVCEEDTIK